MLITQLHNQVDGFGTNVKFIIIKCTAYVREIESGGD
jgi:hypothetical protein